MRHISYNMELDDHYTITNTQDFEYDRHANSGDYDEDGPGIRVIFEKSENLEKFLNDFEFADIDGILDPYIKQHWQNVLNGNDPFWKLARVQVSLDFIWLEFFNKTLCDAWLDAGVDVEDTIPSYIAAIAQEGSLIWTKMRFEVDSLAGSTPTTTLVTIGGPAPTFVTEFDGNKQRTFEFYSRGEHSDSRLVRVTECMK